MALPNFRTLNRLITWYPSCPMNSGRTLLRHLAIHLIFPKLRHDLLFSTAWRQNCPPICSTPAQKPMKHNSPIQIPYPSSPNSPQWVSIIQLAKKQNFSAKVCNGIMAGEKAGIMRRCNISKVRYSIGKTSGDRNLLTLMYFPDLRFRLNSTAWKGSAKAET